MRAPMPENRCFPKPVVWLLPGLLLCGACGLESLLGYAGGRDHPEPVTPPVEIPLAAGLTGRIPAQALPGLTASDLRFYAGAAEELHPQVAIAGEEFRAEFAPGPAIVGLWLEVVRGTSWWGVLVPGTVPGEDVVAGNFDGIDDGETAQVLILLALASREGRHLANYPAATLANALADLSSLEVSDPAVAKFRDMVRAVAACSDCTRGSAPRFQRPRVASTGVVLQSGLHPDFLVFNPLDYDGDGTVDLDTAAFDQALLEALGAIQFRACYCDQEDIFPLCQDARPMIQTVFAASFRDGDRDDNCDTIEAWADDKPGARMFFTAGIHATSPIQDDALNRALGGWIPNQIPMYDDASHGDELAGDGIWSIAFRLPVGLRLGYKYTWGVQGDNWGGTEEWPGNRRLFEVADVNGDHLVGRFDRFGDETSNKDLANQLLPSNGGKGSIDFTTDANSDGIPDARERPRDIDGDCQPDQWWTSTAVTPDTVDCP